MTWIEVVQCRHRASGWTTCHHDSACFLFYYIQNILYIFVSVILSTPAWKLMQPQNVAIRFFVKQTKKPMILQIQYIYGHMFTLKCVSQVRKHELSHSTNVWASFHRTLTSETAAIKNTSDRCALSSGSKSRDIMQIQRLQSNYESASFFLPLSTFRIEIMFFFFFSTVGPNSISIDSCASSEHCIEKYFWLFFFNLFFHGQVQQTLLPWRWPIWRIVFFFFFKIINIPYHLRSLLKSLLSNSHVAPLSEHQRSDSVGSSSHQINQWKNNIVKSQSFLHRFLNLNKMRLFL